ncbi:MAG TPA: hypothetical protein ENI95_15785 [Chloroflexi bacterium]|nr:hypothetical protein [Chloroflexota bacterium]
MCADRSPPLRLRTRASPSRCRDCPPERVCAWACVQGAGIEDIVIGAVLALEGLSAPPALPEGAEPSRAALWESFNANTGFNG